MQGGGVLRRGGEIRFEESEENKKTFPPSPRFPLNPPAFFLPPPPFFSQAAATAAAHPVIFLCVLIRVQKQNGRGHCQKRAFAGVGYFLCRVQIAVIGTSEPNKTAVPV